jgi:hypothetical protein
MDEGNEQIVLVEEHIPTKVVVVDFDECATYIAITITKVNLN